MKTVFHPINPNTIDYILDELFARAVWAKEKGSPAFNTVLNHFRSVYGLPNELLPPLGKHDTIAEVGIDLKLAVWTDLFGVGELHLNYSNSDVHLDLNTFPMIAQ